MVKSTSPFLTMVPSRKCTAVRVPETSGRMSTVDGFQAAGIALPVDDGLVDHFGHVDLGRGGRGLGLGGIGAGGRAKQGIAAAGRDDGCENGEHSKTITRNHDVP